MAEKGKIKEANKTSVGINLCFIIDSFLNQFHLAELLDEFCNTEIGPDYSAMHIQLCFLSMHAYVCKRKKNLMSWLSKESQMNLKTHQVNN